MVDSNSSMCDIRVNQSAGWRLDPHDDREETWELLDNGRQRATIYFKSGNIDKFAKQMFDLNDRTTWGNKTKLTAKDYADIIRVWIDMKMANEGNYNLEDIYDLIAHHRFDKDYKKLSSKDREWIENDAEERGFLESLSPRFFNSLLVTLNEDLIAESKVPNFKFGKKLQYKADDINQMYGFWGTLDVHMDTYEIEEIWNDVWGILTRGWKFSDAGALYYLNAKAGRWLADKVWNDINSQISQPDAIDMILSDYARPSKWKAWSKEYNTFAQEELAECVILEKAEGDRGPISDPKIEKALKTKSEETGVPIGIIRIIMRRGMAAWKTGHRPGATEQQWGYARVNAFLTKGKGTWGDADKDVAKEVRDEGHDDGLKEQNYFDQSHRKQNI
jgi:mRNA-degrading endonuclease RelE of RelBE toxin-antitoxin system